MNGYLVLNVSILKIAKKKSTLMDANLEKRRKTTVKLWVDDVRPAPNDIDYLHSYSVDHAKTLIQIIEKRGINGDNVIELIDIDHDAGDYACAGGDYIKLLDWLEETGRSYPIHIHSMNVVGRMNMEAICRRNGWTIVE